MIFLMFEIIAYVAAFDVVITTNDGKIGGKILQDYDGISIAFNRFHMQNHQQAPIKNDGWNGILDATKVSPFCPQHGKIKGHEDCLYLNVYTPTIKKKLPVMLFIHGGLYVKGSGSGKSLGPEFLMGGNIILVTINYRLGYFGSLSFKNQSLGVPGNAHMKDQVMALKWVQENIRQFGGNPNMVTIFGHSVGGGSVNMHMLSPMSRGLFHRAISQSGWALTPWMEGYVGTGEVLAKKLGITTDSEEIMIEELQKVSMQQILNLQEEKTLITVNKRSDFMPVIETQTNEPTYLHKSPIDIIKSGEYVRVPYIMGYNDAECLIMHAQSYDFFGEPFCPKDFKEYIPFDVNLKSRMDRNIVAKDLRKSFTKNEDNSDLDICTELCNGSWFIASFYRTLVLMMNNSSTPIFTYRFSADTNLNVFKKENEFTANMKGASHLDILAYLFTTPNTPQILPGSKEERTMKKMIKLFTKFAKTGRGAKKWLPVEKCQFNYLEISTKLIPKIDPDPKIINFWSKIYQTYNGDLNLCEIF